MCLSCVMYFADGGFMKKHNILIALLSVLCLSACGETPAPASSNNGGSDSGNQPVGENVFAITAFGTSKFEAEKMDVKDWYPFDGEEVIEEANASGGAYLAAAEEGSEAVFYLSLQAYSRVTMSVAYAQDAENLSKAINLEETIAFHIENLSDFKLGETKTLPARTSATKFDLIAYQPEELYQGEYKVTVEVLSGAEVTPSIDYLQFKTSDATVTPVDPSTITEADIPDNDMRNLQQYKYVLEEDVYKYKTYATGADLSAPRGMKLKYDDVETASKYYVQVAESEAALANANVRESTEKFYYFQNAKLATKYYYRAATSESGLASAKVYDITSTSQAPRVVYVPDVLNFRDIGGWDSELVAGAKINQGLYFRCAQLDAAQGSTTSKLDMTKGVAALMELGIKCDIDMRDSYNQPNRGSGPSKASTTDWPITFVSAAVASGTESVRWEGGSASDRSIAGQYVKIFNAIANADNEPCMLHCTYGADRTGIVTFFLESLLGMSEEDMTKDYLWTQFTQGRNVKILESEGAEFPQWIKKTNALEGATFADKMENHLISFGIEKSTLEHIREIFVPGYVAQA